MSTESHDRELMQLHVEALFTHDANGCLVRVNEPGRAHAPRFFVGETAESTVVRFRHDVDAKTRVELEARVETDVTRDSSRYHAILGRVTPVVNTWSGPVFCFPREIPERTGATRITLENSDALRALLPSWLPDVETCAPMFALIVDGHAVAVCASVRITEHAHEAGVDTAPSYRGRGYAARVVAAWAHAVRETGVVPLYSTSWQNEASRAVARKLGLIQFGNDLHMT